MIHDAPLRIHKTVVVYTDVDIANYSFLSIRNRAVCWYSSSQQLRCTLVLVVLLAGVGKYRGGASPLLHKTLGVPESTVHTIYTIPMTFYARARTRE